MGCLRSFCDSERAGTHKKRSQTKKSEKARGTFFLGTFIEAFFPRNSFDKSRRKVHGEKFIAIFTTPSVVIWFSTGTLGIFAPLVYVFTMRVCF